MSPRAACRLETLGFTQVFDYVAGKKDWIAQGLPTEGTVAADPRAGDVARPDPPTCGLDDRVGAARAETEAREWDTCVVTSEDGCVLGRLRGEAFDNSEALVEEAMESGPTTQRPDVRIGPLTQRMRERGVQQMLVSTPSGRLVGILYREDAERLEEASRQAVWEECEGCPGTWRVQV